ncbi:MAG: TonB family protein [Blastocatellia bacterium]
MNSTNATMTKPGQPPNLRGLMAAFDGQLTIEEALSGSWRTVNYLARETATGRPVRLKVLTECAAQHTRQIQLFHLEAQASAALSHQNVVSTTAAEQISGFHFCLSPQLTQGETLRELIRRRGWMQPAQAISLALQIAGALSHAREHGVLHLCLHPEKILLTADGQALVTGFGIFTGENYDWAGEERAQRCDARYLSPEQAGNFIAGHRSDLYALGVMLYEMLTDRVPFDGDTPAAIRRKRELKTPIAPQRISPLVPESLSRLVMSLLERQPERRPQQVSDLMASLRAILSEIETNHHATGSDTAQPADSGDRYIAAESGEVIELMPFIRNYQAVGVPTSATAMSAAIQDEFRNEPVISRFATNVAAEPVTAPHRDVAAAPATEPKSENRNFRSAQPVAAAFLSGMLAAVNRHRTKLLIITLSALLIAAVTAAAHQRSQKAKQSEQKSEPAQISLPSPAPSPADEKAADDAAATAPVVIEEMVVTAGDATTSKHRDDREPTSRQQAGVKKSEAQAEQASAPSTPEPAAQLRPRTVSLSLPAAAVPGVTPSMMAQLKTEMIGHATSETGADGLHNPPPPSTPQPKPTNAPAAVITRSIPVRRVKPFYPADARERGLKGLVVVEVSIDEKGRVTSARAVQGHMIFRNVAETAASNWQFTPATVNGKPVKDRITITFNFRNDDNRP